MSDSFTLYCQLWPKDSSSRGVDPFFAFQPSMNCQISLSWCQKCDPKCCPGWRWRSYPVPMWQHSRDRRSCPWQCRGFLGGECERGTGDRLATSDAERPLGRVCTCKTPRKLAFSVFLCRDLRVKSEDLALSYVSDSRLKGSFEASQIPALFFWQGKWWKEKEERET